MVDFREENAFLIFWVNFFGLHLTVPEKLIPNKKWVTAFVFLWTKIPITVLPVYILRDFCILIFDEMPILLRFAMARKIFVFSGFCLKNIIFYWKKKNIENLIDLWDGSFLESFYPEEDMIIRRKNLKGNKKIVLASLALAETAAISYSISLFFKEKKKYFRFGEMIDPNLYLEFILAIVFHTCASLSCVSAAAFDSVLVVFLSQVRAKLEFLQERLADIVNEIVIDDEGRLLRRTGSGEVGLYEETEARSEAFHRNTATAEEKLRVWINQHQKAIWFFEEIKKVYSNIASYELGLIVIYTSLTALHIAQVKINLIALGIALVASSNLTSLFLWCKLSGDLGGIDSFGEAFERAWFLFPRKIKTAFSFIIMRSKKPLILFGLSIFPMTLVTFFEILKLTYQFFAFMVRITTTEEQK